MIKNKYANTLLESIDNIKAGLKYYVERCLELENELKVYREMYENRVNEYTKLLKESEKYKQFFNLMLRLDAEYFMNCEDKETNKLVNDILKLESEE